jgi:hypothetical protein
MLRANAARALSPSERPESAIRAITVSADGSAVLSRDERFSLSRCLTLDKRQKPDNVVGLTVSFSVGSEPVETHVYLSLYYKMPLFVRTQSGDLWKVENGTVSAASLP